jgi:hypothetical protein
MPPKFWDILIIDIVIFSFIGIAQFLITNASDAKLEKKNKKVEFSIFDFAEALNNRVFGEFKLADAVSFYKDIKFIPREGYLIEEVPSVSGAPMDRITISVSEEKIYPLFDDLLILLGERVTVVVEDYLDDEIDHVDYFAYEKENIIVRSILSEYENTFVQDGFIGVSVYDDFTSDEVKITDHKTITIFSFDITRFLGVLSLHEIEEDEILPFFYKKQHFHHVTSNHKEVFELLKSALFVEQAITNRLDSDESVV